MNDPQIKFPSKLQKKARYLLLNSPRQLTGKKICEDTGLSPSWLTEFSKGRIMEASAGKLEALYNYLSSKPFDI